MKLLVIGSGGREHALVWKIAQSPKASKVYCAPGNPGTASLAENVAISVGEFEKLVEFAKTERIDLTIVGPEIPLVEGIVDLFEKKKLPIIGPSKRAAQIEGSKMFAKKLMKKYGIPTASFETFSNYPSARSYVEHHHYPLVVKADGPCSGKGVAVCQSFEEADRFLVSLMKDKIFAESGNNVVIEECLFGPEVSFMVATDGVNFVSLLPSQDHKRVYDNDQGPNTGGMGAYAPVPFVGKILLKQIEKEIVAPTIVAMAQEGLPYKGILYPGLILTSQGPKVLEFNCRFGDPETQPLISLLNSDIIDLFTAIEKNQVKKLKLRWKKGAAVCVMLSAKGYPGHFEKGKEIKGLTKLPKAVTAFHSGTAIKNNRVVSSGGRAIGITATGTNLHNTITRVYSAIGPSGVHFTYMHYRTDIGRKGLLNEKPSAYARAGVDYDAFDYVKRLAQREGIKTIKNLKGTSFNEFSASRGESAYVLETPNNYLVFVEEGLGTKNLVADSMRKITGKTYYDAIAQDTVAMMVNDLITVGAKPTTILAYWAVGDSKWFEDKKRSEDLVRGWRRACELAGAVWGGGETPTLKDIIYPHAIDLAGAAFGIIQPKKQLVLGDRLYVGDVIIFLGSSGIHANGLTLARKLADGLPRGYATKLVDGRMYGEALLTPTTIYNRVVGEVLDKGIPLSYMVNITGHGWRKLMRHPKKFTHIINQIPQKQALFEFIQKKGHISDDEMYAIFNMGVGFAIYVREQDAQRVLTIARKQKIKAWIGGRVEKGEKKVIIKPLGITYEAEDLKIR